MSALSPALLSLVLSLTLTPHPPQRPTSLVGSWRAAGLELTLSATGEALIYEPNPPAPPQLLERSRWWVEGDELCLTAGLSRACEPYTLSAERLSLPARGVIFTRQPPRPHASNG